MCKLNHKDIVEREAKGQILIEIEPAVARRFFTQAHHRVLQQEIGETLFVQRSFVKTFSWLSVLSLLAGMIASIFAVNWYSVLAIPVMIVGWFILGARASVGSQKLGGAFGLMLICLISAYYVRDKGVVVTIWVVLLPLPYFFDRLTYRSATVFLRSLSVSNERAFNLLYDKGIFLKEVSVDR
ncbi:MAG: hypothetical protein ACYSYV_03670 [Planctomycetota bacterium]|jgi:hypothetical protein